MKKIIIAIDGHSSCGKSTLAKSLGNALQYAYISTGDMYRAVTLYLIDNQIDIKDIAVVKKALTNIKIEFKNVANDNRIFLNGCDVQDEIKKMYVSEKVSPIATISEVRREMVHQQQKMGATKGIVMDGRDIGTVVFPNAELKIFLTASANVRAQRRYEELVAKGFEADLEKIKENLLERDHIDSTRADSPLKKAIDAIVVDNSNLNRTEQLEKVIALVQERQKY